MNQKLLIQPFPRPMDQSDESPSKAGCEDRFLLHIIVVSSKVNNLQNFFWLYLYTVQVRKLTKCESSYCRV
jgi:hypothetical protein